MQSSQIDVFDFFRQLIGQYPIILFIIIAIIFLALVFSKTKSNEKVIRKNFYASGEKRRTFKDFERERRFKESAHGKSKEGRVFELGGYGVTRAATRSESHFEPSGDYSDERITNDPHGIFGESAMAALTARVCDNDKRKYILMRNLYIPARNGTTEIDALLLHQSGIYVLESKNIAGEITGSLEMERWNQYLNKNTEHTFHNPIRQNIGHIMALQHHLKIRREQSHFISIIVFSDRCVLKQVPVNNEFWRIVHCSELRDELQHVIKNRKTVYTKEQLEDFYWKLEPCMHPSEKVKASHKAYVQEKARS